MGWGWAYKVEASSSPHCCSALLTDGSKRSSFCLHLSVGLSSSSGSPPFPPPQGWAHAPGVSAAPRSGPLPSPSQHSRVVFTLSLTFSGSSDDFPYFKVIQFKMEKKKYIYIILWVVNYYDYDYKDNFLGNIIARDTTSFPLAFDI